MRFKEIVSPREPPAHRLWALHSPVVRLMEGCLCCGFARRPWPPFRGSFSPSSSSSFSVCSCTSEFWVPLLAPSLGGCWAGGRTAESARRGAHSPPPTPPPPTGGLLRCWAPARFQEQTCWWRPWGGGKGKAKAAEIRQQRRGADFPVSRLFPPVWWPSTPVWASGLDLPAAPSGTVALVWGRSKVRPGEAAQPLWVCLRGVGVTARAAAAGMSGPAPWEPSPGPAPSASRGAASTRALRLGFQGPCVRPGRAAPRGSHPLGLGSSAMQGGGGPASW